MRNHAGTGTGTSEVRGKCIGVQKVAKTLILKGFRPDLPEQ